MSERGVYETFGGQCGGKSGMIGRRKIQGRLNEDEDVM